MDSITFQLVGDVTVNVTITELADGSLQFDLNVVEETGTIGDLNALYLDILDESLLDGLSVTSGDDVTGEKFQADKVTKIDNFTNVNGEVVNEYGKFDLGIQFGTSGMATDDIQSTSFVLSHDSEVLTIDQFLNQDAAVRLTSVGTIDGARENSSKIGGTVDPIEPVGPTNTANDDVLVVDENESFDPFGFGFEPLNVEKDASGFVTDFDVTLLGNDTTDSAAYTGVVTGIEQTDAVTGETSIVELVDGLVFAGSNGGLLTVQSDGTVDFSANGDFDSLMDGETAFTDFVYEIEGGDTATLMVQINGVDDSTGGGGGDGEGGTSEGGMGGDTGTDGDIILPDDPFAF